MRRASKNIQGQFESRDPKTGLWLIRRNIFTLVGWEQILTAAFHGAGLTWEVGLCNATPAPELEIDQIGEPDSTNGYARQALVQGDTDWEEIGAIENESYVLSKEFTFTATGAYSGPVSRLFLADEDDNVISMSASFGLTPVVFDESTDHRYRLYFH